MSLDEGRIISSKVKIDEERPIIINRSVSLRSAGSCVCVRARVGLINEDK